MQPGIMASTGHEAPRNKDNISQHYHSSVKGIVSRRERTVLHKIMKTENGPIQLPPSTNLIQLIATCFILKMNPEPSLLGPYKTVVSPERPVTKCDTQKQMKR